jgi:hypothetical protein
MIVADAGQGIQAERTAQMADWHQSLDGAVRAQQGPPQRLTG